MSDKPTTKAEIRAVLLDLHEKLRRPFVTVEMVLAARAVHMLDAIPDPPPSPAACRVAHEATEGMVRAADDCDATYDDVVGIYRAMERARVTEAQAAGAAQGEPSDGERDSGARVVSKGREALA